MSQICVVPSTFSTTNDFLASATGRLGYVYGGGLWMFYARGGVAWTRDKYEDPFVFAGGPSVDPTATANRTGWTFGGGVEWAFAPQWSVALESNYYEYKPSFSRMRCQSPPSRLVSGIR